MNPSQSLRAFLTPDKGDERVVSLVPPGCGLPHQQSQQLVLPLLQARLVGGDAADTVLGCVSEWGRSHFLVWV